MRVNCAGCAGCCVDWRPLAPDAPNHERRDGRVPLDDAYNLVPLLRDEVRDYVDAGFGDALTPRLWRVPATNADASATTIDGHRVAAVDGRPVFFVGLRKPPKPVGPFGTDARWLDACAFLDPETLKCRIHEDELYPETCGVYPGANLELGAETECERVEARFDGERLLDRTPPEHTGLRLGPAAVGAKLFVHPDPERLAGVVDRAASGSLTAADRAEFVGVAVGSRPGSTEVDEERAARARDRTVTADSWAGRVADEWERRAGDPGDAPASDEHADASAFERARGAPDVSDWD
ncbi:YkgJ family cysteine cluster protein [Halobium salinum]|uniref:YkgJ family cysteine cluster protein n=1 Tax=Halobium salinum TaxID=1364940 RepID=A0ABD5PFK8_9EURY|nr:YkgJ family cysteine cluster protein [Halobium salinum]